MGSSGGGVLGTGKSRCKGPGGRRGLEEQKAGWLERKWPVQNGGGGAMLRRKSDGFKVCWGSLGGLSDWATGSGLWF